MKAPNDKVFDFAAHEAVIDKLVKQRFAHSFMSNSKWQKLFKILDKTAPHIQVIWKFVTSPNDGVRHSLPPMSALNDRYLNDNFWFGPCYYKEIEWLEFPKLYVTYGMEMVPGAHKPQDTNVIKEALTVVGSWEFEETESGLRMYGYKPNNNKGEAT